MMYQIVTSHLFSELVRRSFNAPLLDVEYSQIDFELEYQNKCAELIAECRGLGINEDDLSIWETPPTPPSRLMQLIVNAEEAWTGEFIWTLARMIQKGVPAYAIWVFHEIITMDLCDVFIANGKIIGSGDLGLLQRAGFPVPD